MQRSSGSQKGNHYGGGRSERGSEQPHSSSVAAAISQQRHHQQQELLASMKSMNLAELGNPRTHNNQHQNNGFQSLPNGQPNPAAETGFAAGAPGGNYQNHANHQSQRGNRQGRQQNHWQVGDECMAKVS